MLSNNAHYKSPSLRGFDNDHHGANDMPTLTKKEAEEMLGILKANFLKRHATTVMYGTGNYTDKNSDRIISLAVKNGDAPEIKILMQAMGLISKEEKTDEIS